MPDEYISREKTLALLKSLGSRDYRREKGTIQDAIKMISSAEYTTAADVVPVRHGHWIDGFIPDSMLCGCSECGFTCGAHSFLYCPSCGAKMDGETEGNDG